MSPLEESLTYLRTELLAILGRLDGVSESQIAETIDRIVDELDDSRVGQRGGPNGALAGSRG